MYGIQKRAAEATLIIEKAIAHENARAPYQILSNFLRFDSSSFFS